MPRDFNDNRPHRDPSPKELKARKLRALAALSMQTDKLHQIAALLFECGGDLDRGTLLHETAEMIDRAINRIEIPNLDQVF